MKDRLKTLILNANGYGWPAVLVDTTLDGLLRRKKRDTLPFGLERFYVLRMLLGQRYDHLSYMKDWRDAFCGNEDLDVTLCNINDLLTYRRVLRDIRDYDLVIVLHSAAGDSVSILKKTAHRLGRRQGKLVVFIGNEYDLLPEKMAFVRESGADFLCTQLPLAAARWLYQGVEAALLEMPHALNPAVYSPGSHEGRDVDIGFVGALYDNIVGDRERTSLIRYFKDHGPEFQLNCDIRLRTGDLITKGRNLTRNKWADFLRRCKAVVGAEAGSYYVDRSGTLMRNIKAYLNRKRLASFEEVFDKFYRNVSSPVSGKCISSRHFEPIGTKTCQVLVEGAYNGVLEADSHYIRVKKDLSNIAEVIDRFRDDDYRRSMAERTYEYVMSCHTYQHRVSSLIQQVSRGRR